MKSNIAMVLLAIGLAACGGKKDDGASSSAKPADKGGDKAADTGGGPQKLAQLDGLSIEFAGEVGKAIGGDGVMIQGDKGVVTVEAVKEPKKIEDAKSDADMYSPKNYKEEKLPDGFVITYDNSGSMGANFFVDAYRTIGGKTYHCSTTGSEKAQQDAVVAACKSLKK